MAGLDPEDDVAEGDTSSVDASKPGIQKAWNAWTSKPENNAALLQFGLSMLQPRAPGQSAIGAAANSVASGGEAAGRVLANQRVEDVQNSSEEDKKALRESQLLAAQGSNAANMAYAENLKAGGGAGKGGLSNALKVQQGFRSWMVKPEDTTGMNADPILGAVQKQFPNIKTKADLLNDPAAKVAAMRIYATVAPEAEDEASAAPVAPTPSPPAAGVPAPMKYNNRIIHVDPASKQWVYEDGSPAK